MSFDTYREFEASLQAARDRRKKPNVNKRVLKKFILSTEAHNRNQEEQEMWTKHFASKNKNSETSSSDERHGKKKKTARKKERVDEKKEKKKRYDDGSLSSGDDIGPDIGEYMRRSAVKWGHDGYRELYGHTEGSQAEKEKKSSKKTSHHSRKDHEASDIDGELGVSSEKRKISNGKKRARKKSSDDSDMVCASRKKAKKSKRKKNKKKFEWVEKP